MSGGFHGWELSRSIHSKVCVSEMNWGAIRIMIGTVGGGLLGFYVMHEIENNHKEKIRAEIAKLQLEESRLAQQSKSEGLPN